MIYGYCRVSRIHQTELNQRFEIEQFAQTNQFHVDIWIEERISSQERLSCRQLGLLLPTLQDGDILITTELSRIGRSLLEVMSILQMCLERNCQVWTLKENFRLGQDLQSKVLAFAFGLSAEIERSLIQSRTREALARIKADGRKLGRPFGSHNQELKLSQEAEKIHMYLQQGYTKPVSPVYWVLIEQPFTVFVIDITSTYRYPTITLPEKKQNCTCNTSESMLKYKEYL